MDRIPWKRNHKCEQPSRLVFYDCETIAYPSESDPEYLAHRFQLGVAHFWINKAGVWQRDFALHFSDLVEFWTAIYDFVRSRRPTWVYAHNAAFDFTIVGGWEKLDSESLRIIETSEQTPTKPIQADAKTKTWKGKTALDGMPFILETRCDKGPIKWVDTYNYWPVSLKKLGEAVQLEKLEYEPFDSPPEARRYYCQRDVEIIEKAVLSLMDLWKANDLGNWQPTAASLAFSSYRHGKETSTLVSHGDRKLNHDDRIRLESVMGHPILDAFDITECERRSYYGGRTAVYYLGDISNGMETWGDNRSSTKSKPRPLITGPITVLDVNSLFPYCMLEYQHPIELVEAIKYPQFSQAQRLIEEFPCCADVEVDSDTTAYPKRSDNFTVYCTGNFVTSLGFAELSGAVARGEIRSVANLCIYHYGRPFRNFVESWHKRRKDYIDDGKDVQAGFCKLIMNSLYGKLAQKTPPWVTCGHITPPVRWGGFIGACKVCQHNGIMRAIGGQSQYRSIPKSCRHTFVAAAASVTSWARVHMQNLIDACPPNSIVYMDTDSLFCLPSALSALNQLGLIHPTELGKLKIKGTYNRVRIWGLKDYELDDERVIAGLRADATQLSERLWKQVNFEGVRQIIQHDPTSEVMQSDVRFSPAAQLPGHTVGWDGWCKPWRVE